MSIRQLSFEEGEELNIRECVKLLPKNTSIEKLQELAANEEMKIVKSGKSYFDVTSKPEIFEKAHEFDINSLTSIDQRESKEVNIQHAFEEAQNADPMSILYQNTSKPKEEPQEFMKRQTYYLRADQIEALRLIRFKEVKDVSAVVREFFDIAIAEKSKEHGTDFKEEAEHNLMIRANKNNK